MVGQNDPPERSMQMDKANVEYQLKRVQDSVDEIVKVKKTLASLQDGQTPGLWTGDGKSVDLIEQLKVRYRSSERWVTEIGRDLVAAGANLRKAIDETEELDAAAKQKYQQILATALGSLFPFAPLAPLAPLLPLASDED